MNRIVLMLFFLCSTASSQTVDTLFYGNTKKIHRNPYGWGYIAGTNHYIDIGKYQRFDVLDEVHVVGAKVWMGVKKIAGTADSITIVFKKVGYGSANADKLAGGPGATVGTIKTALDVFDTTGKGNVFTLSKPFNVRGNPFLPESVFVGLEWSAAANDTFALFADDTGQGDKADRAWEQLTGAAFKYQRFNEPGDFTWALDADIWIALLYKKGLLAVRNTGSGSPHEFSLEQNYPNPFNPSTKIGFSVPVSGVVSLKVFDMIGKEIAVLVNEYLETGTYTSSFSARSIPSGMYFYQLRYGAMVETKKMVLVK